MADPVSNSSGDSGQEKNERTALDRIVMLSSELASLRDELTRTKAELDAIKSPQPTGKQKARRSLTFHKNIFKWIFSILKERASYHPISALLVLLVLCASIFVMSRTEEPNRLLDFLINQETNAISLVTLRAEVNFTSKTVSPERAKEAEENSPVYYSVQTDLSSKILESFLFFCNDRTWGNRRNMQKPDAERMQCIISIPDFRQKIGDDNFIYLKKVLGDETFYEEFCQRFENEILRNGIFKETPDSKNVVIIKDKDSVSPITDSRNVSTPENAGIRTADFLTKQYSNADSSKVDSFKKVLSKELETLFHGGNVQKDEAKTRKELENAKGKAKNAEYKVYVGDLIVERGKKITSNVKQQLTEYKNALNDQKKKHSKIWNQRVGKAALSIVFMIFSLLYLHASSPFMLNNRRFLLNISIIAILSLLANFYSALFFYKTLPNTDFYPELVFLAIPLALPAILVSSIYGIRASVFVGIFLSGIAAISTRNSFPVFATGMLVSAISGFAIRNVSDYKKFFMTAFFFIAGTTFFCGFVFLLHENIISLDNWTILRGAAILSLVTGLVTPMLALLLLFPLETFFDVSSNMSYISFTDRNHPLLKRLQQEAPGTYHHSDRVASIAEKAADAIGVNPLLVQTCALFHDIGKLHNPGLFTENAPNGNPLGDCSPYESVEIIRDHVAYGLELAKKYKLKSSLCRAIERHHGTDFISFFYDLAKKNSQAHPGQEPPKEEDFRYAGPLPDERETALLSLADCAEAMTRSIPNPTHEILQERLTKLFNAKLEHGQLDKAPLTAAELRIIRDSFVESLAAMNHVRIAYPKFKKEDSVK